MGRSDGTGAKFTEAIAASGPDAVAFYGSGQLFSEESYTANKLFKAGIRTNNVDANALIAWLRRPAATRRCMARTNRLVAEDIDYADCIFMIGANPANAIRRSLSVCSSGGVPVRNAS